MDLIAILERMESINRRIEHAVHSPDKNLQMLILGLRHDFASQCGDFLKALSDDPRTANDRALFEDLQDRFDEMRTKLAVHQRKWQALEIRQDYAGYSAATRRIFGTVAAFTQDARERLEACEPAGEGIGLQMLRVGPAREDEHEREEVDLSMPSEATTHSGKPSE